MPGVLLCCLVHQTHLRGPLTAVLLCRSVHQAPKGAPWVGSYSVVQCIRHLIGQPLYCSAADAGVWEERDCCDQQYRLASTAARLSSTGISHHNLLPRISLICLSAVNSSLCPRIAPQSLNCSSQPLHLPGDLCFCPGYAWLWKDCLILIVFRLPCMDQLFHSHP